MGWSIKLFRIAGIRLELHFTFAIILAIFAWDGYQLAGSIGALGGLLMICLIFLSVILHELGHSLVAKAYGVPVPRIVLLPIGGMAQIERLPRRPFMELMITGAGPLVNLVIAAALWIGLGALGHSYLEIMGEASRSAGAASQLQTAAFQFEMVPLVAMLIVFNTFMAIFNLLPIYPMDGGRLLRAGLAFKFPYIKATKWSVAVSKGLLIAGIFFALFVTQNFLMAALFTFVWLAGEAEYRQLLAEDRYYNLFVRDITRSLPREALSTEVLMRNPLQASWPLGFCASLIERSEPGTVFPVYDGEQFLGIVVPDDLPAQAKRAKRPEEPPRLSA